MELTSTSMMYQHGRSLSRYDPGWVIGFLLNAERTEKLRALLVDSRPYEPKERVRGS